MRMGLELCAPNLFFYVENHMGYGFYIPPTGLWTCGSEAILVRKEGL